MPISKTLSPLVVFSPFYRRNSPYRITARIAREAPIKSDGDAASAMPKSVLLNRVCAMQTHREPLNSALISGSQASNLRNRASILMLRF